MFRAFFSLCLLTLGVLLDAKTSYKKMKKKGLTEAGTCSYAVALNS